jgi:sodium/potassium-transporting ATPase subunit alpha
MFPPLACLQFNSTNKWQLSIHRPEDAAAQHPIMVLKGAPERVLRMCTHIMLKGERVPMDEDWQAKYNEAYESLGAMGERVLGFAYREMDEVAMDYPFTNKPESNFQYDNLTFVGLMSLIDPPREGVKEAVEKCKRARIKVFMVTGDHPITAQVSILLLLLLLLLALSSPFVLFQQGAAPVEHAVLVFKLRPAIWH